MTHNPGAVPPAEEAADYVSKMIMHPQDTDQTIIDYEESLIRQDLGLTDGENVVLDNEGWDSRVYLIDAGKTIYKFPRAPQVGYAHEIAALTLAATIDSEVATQKFEHADPNGRFVRYRGLVGEQLSTLLPTMEASEKQRIGNQLGIFLRKLHTLDMADVKVVTVDDEIAEYQAKYQLAKPVLAATLSDSEQKTVAQFFHEQMPVTMRELGTNPTLCHGDLGTYNIIVDREGRPGIIDFGNIGYYDHSKDFIDFWDATLFNAVLQTYGDSELLRAKAAVRILALPVIDIVYYTAKDHTEGVQVTIDRLRAALPQISEEGPMPENNQ